MMVVKQKQEERGEDEEEHAQEVSRNGQKQTTENGDERKATHEPMMGVACENDIGGGGATATPKPEKGGGDERGRGMATEGGRGGMSKSQMHHETSTPTATDKDRHREAVRAARELRRKQNREDTEEELPDLKRLKKEAAKHNVNYNVNNAAIQVFRGTARDSGAIARVDTFVEGHPVDCFVSAHVLERIRSGTEVGGGTSSSSAPASEDADARENDIFGLVWSSKGAEWLRIECRIVGQLLGSVPQFRQQNEVYGLPMKLCAEELFVALRKKWINIVSSAANEYPGAADIRDKRLDTIIKAANSEKKDQAQVLVSCAKMAAEESVQVRLCLQTAAAIPSDREGASDGDGDGAGGNLITACLHVHDPRSDLKAIYDANNAFVLRHLSTRRTNRGAIVDIRTKKCQVFYDLHAQGYTMTSGLKFGAHFLVYPGDPMIFHAQFMAVVVDELQALCPLHIAATARCARDDDSVMIPHEDTYTYTHVRMHMFI